MDLDKSPASEFSSDTHTYSNTQHLCTDMPLMHAMEAS